MRGCILGVSLGMLAGCATPPSDPAARAEWEATNDPFEPANRYFFELNRFLDIMFLKPVADTYRRVVPDEGQRRVSNILANAKEPVIFANTLLQGRLEDSASTLGRFAVNSTLGLGGIFDVATDFGLPAKEGDFGQTLYSWGFEEEGPYLVLPLRGPSNPRDAVGIGVDAVMDPTGWIFTTYDLSSVNYGRMGGEAVSGRAGMIDTVDTLEKSSVDFYAQVRSFYRQNRNAQLKGTAATTTPDFDPYADPAADKSAKSAKPAATPAAQAKPAPTKPAKATKPAKHRNHPAT